MTGVGRTGDAGRGVSGRVRGANVRPSWSTAPPQAAHRLPAFTMRLVSVVFHPRVIAPVYLPFTENPVLKRTRHDPAFQRAGADALAGVRCSLRNRPVCDALQRTTSSGVPAT